jgi:tRNA (adenine-N(1)-)-methyltransferase non-catalytic subunit
LLLLLLLDIIHAIVLRVPPGLKNTQILYDTILKIEAKMASAEGPQKDEAMIAVEELNDNGAPDPLLEQRSAVVREGDFALLVFGDGRQIFAHCVKSWKGKSPPVKIYKRSYPTANLVGLPYGTVLELGMSSLNPLSDGEEVIPAHPSITGGKSSDTNQSGDSDGAADGSNLADTTMPPLEQVNDNRHIVDNNKSQSLDHEELLKLRQSGACGSTIVSKLIENSSTFEKKTDFSKAKYVLRKQKKYQPRCRIVRCTAASICEALYLKDPRRLMNMREDTLGQILSYSNLSAGCQALVFETCMGVVTGAVAERMGGYGKVMSIYSGQQPAYVEMLGRFNLSFPEYHSIKWVHSGDVFGEDAATSDDPNADPELAERKQLKWPCPLQDHTRAYLENMKTDRERTEFLAKRCARFARKLTRHTPLEAKQWLDQRKCDTVIIVTKYDPTATLLGLLPYLAPSSPFVVFCEFIEPLTECFRELQNQSLAINLRLSDTWMREFQVLPGRTHPSMSMSQSGGFILTGIKLCPVTGQNELDDALLQEIRNSIGGRRGKKSKNKNNNQADGNNKKDKKRKAAGGREVKRPRMEPS